MKQIITILISFTEAFLLLIKQFADVSLDLLINLVGHGNVLAFFLLFLSLKLLLLRLSKKLPLNFG